MLGPAEPTQQGNFRFLRTRGKNSPARQVSGDWKREAKGSWSTSIYSVQGMRVPVKCPVKCPASLRNNGRGGGVPRRGSGGGGGQQVHSRNWDEAGPSTRLITPRLPPQDRKSAASPFFSQLCPLFQLRHPLPVDRAQPQRLSFCRRIHHA